MYELVYTSAPHGLRPGASGYTVVAQTSGIPAGLADALEGLSQYRHRRVAADAAGENPVAYAHYILSVGFQRYHVLSRVADAGLDYSGRGNFLAHHLAAADDHLPPAGPAWVLAYPDVFLTRWDRPPTALPPRGRMRTGDAPPKPCRAWEAATGDAGWGGVLAAATDPARPAVVVFEPGQDVLPLIAEAVALLPAEERWQVSFSSYFIGTPAGVRCQWRFVPADSPDLTKLLAAGPAVVIRTDRSAGEEPDGPLVAAARTGKTPAVRRINPVVPVGPLPASRGDTPAPAARPTAAADSEVMPVVNPRPYAPADEPSNSGIGRLLVGLACGAAATLLLLVGVEAAAGKSFVGLFGGKKPDTPAENVPPPSDPPLPADAPPVKAAPANNPSDEAKVKALKQEKEGVEQAYRDAARDRDRARQEVTTAQVEMEKVKLQVEELKQAALKQKKTDTPPETQKVVSAAPPDAKVVPFVIPLERQNERFVGKFGGRSGATFDQAGLTKLTRKEQAGPGRKGWDVKQIKDQTEPKNDPTVCTVSYAVEGGNTVLEVRFPLNESPFQLQAGLIKVTIPDEKATWLFHPYTAPHFETTKFFGKRNAEDKLYYLTWDSKNNDKLHKAINDYSQYLAHGGTLHLHPHALLRIRDRLVPLSPSKDNPKQKLVSSEKDELVTIELDEKGQLVIKSPNEIFNCDVVYAEVVRPIEIDGLAATQSTVFRIGTP